MADKFSGENAGRDDLTDTGLHAADPFAELTRIMGFDPRKAQESADLAEQSASGDEFNIDLEEELMLGFEEDEQPVQAAPQIVAAPAFEEPLPELPVQEDVAPELDAYDEPQSVMASEETPAYEPAYDQAHAYEPEADAVFSPIETDLAPQAEALAHEAPEFVAHEASEFVAHEAPVYAAHDDVVDAYDMMSAELEMQHDALDEPLPVIKLSPVSHEAAAVEAAPVQDAAPYETAELDVADLEAEFNALLGGSDGGEIVDASAGRLSEVEAAQPHFDDYEPDLAMAQMADDPSVEFGFNEPVEALDAVNPASHDEAYARFAQYEEQPVEEAVLASEEELEPSLEPQVDVVAEAPVTEAPVIEAEEPMVAKEPEAPAEDDPFAMLAAMAQKYRTMEPDNSWRSSVSHITRATPQINRTVATPTLAQPVAPVAPVAVEPAPVAVEPVFEVEPMAAPVHQHEAAYAEPVVEQQAYVPEIDTVEVFDKAVILANDLDIPDVVIVDEPPVVAPVDDLDAEFNNLLAQMSAPSAPSAPHYTHDAAPVASSVETHRPVTETQPAQPRPDAYAGYLAGTRHVEPAPAQSAPYQAPSYAAPAQAASSYAAPAAPAAPVYTQPTYAAPARHVEADEDIRVDLTEDDLADAFDGFDAAALGDIDLETDLDTDMDTDLDGGFDDDVAPMAYQQQQPKRRGLLIAAIVGGVAILAVAGAVAMSLMGDAQGSAPELVKADQAPFKVRPENPGGTVAPNQNSKVYETIGRTDAAGGVQQERLVSNDEVPVDLPDQLPMNGDDDLAMVDEGAAGVEERIEPNMADEGSQGSDTIAIAPRKVRTMVVRPDGTLVPREELKPQASNETAEPQNDATPVNSIAAAIQSGQDDEIEPQPGVTSEQTASIEPQAAQPQTTASGEWMMQIASETSEAAANATYQKMLGRYGKVLDGKGVNIVKAEIAGKGTFWRIRVPASTRDEAAGMCERLKSAGGKCFVTKA